MKYLFAILRFWRSYTLFIILLLAATLVFAPEILAVHILHMASPYPDLSLFAIRAIGCLVAILAAALTIRWVESESIPEITNYIDDMP